MSEAIRSVPRRFGVGSVSYLNAKPLIHGLEADGDIDLHLEVPSRLLEGLQAGRFDVALLPVIDYQRMAGLKVVTAGGIGSDGETLTVRLFSASPIELTRTLVCDTDSHTSVALARVVLAERYGIRPEIVDWRHQSLTDGATLLLIGDKVVCEGPKDLPHQLDLGMAWKELTGLPFLFATWMARGGIDLGDLPERLQRAKCEGMKHLPEIVRQHAVPRGWPAEVARKYLTEHMKYDVGDKQIEAMRLFHELAARHRIIASPARPLEIYGATAAGGV